MAGARVLTVDGQPATLTGLEVAVLGGTGEQGRGLGVRFALAGHHVVLGSRDEMRARAVAAALAAALPEGEGTGKIAGASNEAAALSGAVVVVAVPWDGHRELLARLASQLAGKVVVDCVNPLGFDSQGSFSLAVEEGSAAEQAAAVLPQSHVVAAFHHVSAVLLLDPAQQLDSDVFVLGNDRAATDLVIGLADSVPGLRGVYAGRLRNARQVEGLTANLISVNRRHRTHAGLRVTGLPLRP